MSAGFFPGLLCAAALCLSSGAFAAGREIASEAGAAPKSASTQRSADKTQAKAAALFSKPAVFRGTLGDMPIQFAVRPKEVIDEGLEGEYFIFGQSQKILLAGELEDESIILEESEDGTSISGLWEGQLQGDLIQGTWASADGSVSKPFKLKLIPSPAAAQKPGTARKAPSAEAISATNR